jgi:hypothetical protein
VRFGADYTKLGTVTPIRGDAAADPAVPPDDPISVSANRNARSA